MKKALNTLAMIVFFLTGTIAQPWMHLIPEDKKNSKKINFHDEQKAFYEYWQGKKIERSRGYKQFKRWEEFMEARVFSTGELLNTLLWEEQKKVFSQKNTSANWISLGPWETPTDINTTTFRQGSGRLNVIAFHPSDPNVLYAGSPSGGFWESTTGGNSWTTTTDQLSSIGVSDIAVNPINPDIIYLATGDGDGGNTYSIGILKSTNGGINWQIAGNNLAVQDGITYRRIIIHPSNPSVLIAAGSYGIFKTTDSGLSWTQIQTGEFKDLQFKPGNPDIIYAASYNRWGGADIYRSLNGGNTFSQLTTGINSSEVNRIVLGTTPANPEIVYVLCSAASDNGFHAIYKSTNSGDNWTETFNVSSANLLTWSSTGAGSGGQGSYDLAMTVSLTDANTIYVGGVNIWKSTDGGSNWSINAHWYGDNGVAYVHADQHFFAINPLNNVVYSANDGGLHKTINGTDWIDISDGLQILQIYRIGSSASNPNIVLSGTQDNGSMKYDDGLWMATIGGDGMECIVDYSNENILYSEYYYGAIHKSTDGGYNWHNIQPSGASGAWITPYVMHPTNPNILFAAYSQLYKTTNGGADWQNLGGPNASGSLRFLAVAPSNPDIIITGDYSSIYKSTDGGNTWNNVGSGLAGNAIKSVAFCYDNPQKIWITQSGFSDGEKIYMSTNGGLSWTNYSQGLPNLPVNCIVYEKNTNDALYAGTDAGVFYRNAFMSQWISFNTGLPNVIVNELEIQYMSRKLRAGTYGRGLWESHLYEEPAVPVAAFNSQIVNSCTGDVNFFSVSTGVPTSYLWDFGDGTSASEMNPIHTFPATGAYPVKLIVSNAFGTDSVTQNLTLQSLPVTADFRMESGITCDAPAFVYFVNESANGNYTYSWDFGDGFTSTELHPYHTYNNAGVYNVKLVAYGGFCSDDSLTQNEAVNINSGNSAVQSMLMSGISPTQICCSGTLYDSGGQGVYQNNTHSIITIAPNDAENVTLNFNLFDFEPGSNGSCDYDYLAIYDGADVNAPVIGLYCNNTIPPNTIQSTGSAITIEQYSDPGVTGEGFELTWSCLVSENKINFHEEMITIFPNPNNGNFYVSSKLNSSEKIIKVYDVSGKILYQEIVKSKNSFSEISLKDLKAGVYFIKVETEGRICWEKIFVY